jgi:hypothetical protein
LPSEETAGKRPIELKTTLKNPLELAEEKDARITQLKREISALRIAIPLLLEEKDINGQNESEQFPKQAS